MFNHSKDNSVCALCPPKGWGVVRRHVKPAFEQSKHSRWFCSLLTATNIPPSLALFQLPSRFLGISRTHQKIKNKNSSSNHSSHSNFNHNRFPKKPSFPWLLCRPSLRIPWNQRTWWWWAAWTVASCAPSLELQASVPVAPLMAQFTATEARRGPARPGRLELFVVGRSQCHAPGDGFSAGDRSLNPKPNWWMVWQKTTSFWKCCRWNRAWRAGCEPSWYLKKPIKPQCSSDLNICIFFHMKHPVRGQLINAPATASPAFGRGSQELGTILEACRLVDVVPGSSPWMASEPTRIGPGVQPKKHRKINGKSNSNSNTLLVYLFFVFLGAYLQGKGLKTCVKTRPVTCPSYHLTRCFSMEAQPMYDIIWGKQGKVLQHGYAPAGTPWIAGFRSSRRLQRSSSSSQDARVKEVRVEGVCVSRLDNPLKYGLLAVPTADNMIR